MTIQPTEIKFGNNAYKIICDDPTQIQNLADKIQSSIDALKEKYGQVTETKLLFITALTLQDQVNDLKEKLADSDSKLKKNNITEEKNLAASLNSIAELIENVAISFKKK